MYTGRVENEAGEKRMGCDYTHPRITATGNAGRTRTFRLFRITFFRWVATSCSLEQQGLQVNIITVLRHIYRGCKTIKKGKENMSGRLNDLMICSLFRMPWNGRNNCFISASYSHELVVMCCADERGSYRGKTKTGR